MKFSASSTNSVSASSPCTASEVTTRAVMGVPCAFSCPRNRGKSSCRAGMNITSAAISVHAR